MKNNKNLSDSIIIKKKIVKIVVYVTLLLK